MQGCSWDAGMQLKRRDAAGVQGGQSLTLTWPKKDGKLGMRLGVLPQVGYVVVLSIIPGGAAEKMGVERGDALL